MTNFEKYKYEILKIAEAGGELIGVKDGKPVACESLKGCSGCDLAGDKVSCLFDFIEWACKVDDADCSPDAGKPNTAKGGCEGCHYQGNHILNLPCCRCERAIMDCFEPKKKQERKRERKTKTRRDEFLEHYPNANVLGIQPCSIEKENFGEYCGKYDECYECVDDYWAQEVE